MGEKLFLESVDKMGIAEIHHLNSIFRPEDDSSQENFDYIEFLDHLYHDFVDYKKRP